MGLRQAATLLSRNSGDRCRLRMLSSACRGPFAAQGLGKLAQHAARLCGPGLMHSARHADAPSRPPIPYNLRLLAVEGSTQAVCRR